MAGIGALREGEDQMKRLEGISIKQTARIYWTSKEAEAYWLPRVSMVTSSIDAIETMSVAEGLRECAWKTIDERTVPDLASSLGKIGLIVRPISRTGKWEGFSHYTVPPDPEKVGNVSCIISRKMSAIDEFEGAYRAGDHNTQGRLLGFPECCREAFVKNWADGLYDPVYQAAEASGTSTGEREITVVPIWQANAALRYVGIRIGYHIACDFRCKETEAWGDRLLKVAAGWAGDPVRIRRWLRELLSMPMEWSVLHGIVQVKTPILYVVASSLPTAEKHVIRIMGSHWPVAGAESTVFPFNASEQTLNHGGASER